MTYKMFTFFISLFLCVCQASWAMVLTREITDEIAAARDQALWDLGKTLLESKEYDKALPYLKEAVTVRDKAIAVKASIQLGEMYTLGQGVAKDFGIAREYFLLIRNSQGIPLLNPQLNASASEEKIRYLNVEDLFKLIGSVSYIIESDSKYRDMRIFLEFSFEVFNRASVNRFTGEQISSLPVNMRKRVILSKLVKFCGHLSVKESSLWSGRGVEGATSMFVTSDGYIILGMADNTVCGFDQQGKELAVCRGHEKPVTSISVTNDGSIVSGSCDNTVRVWDMTGKERAVCKGHTAQVNLVCLTHDGKIVSGSYDGTVRVWDITGKQLTVCKGPKIQISSICVTDDNNIVAGVSDHTIRVWDIAGKELAVCRGHKDTIRSVCVTKDGKIVSGSTDDTVRVWDIKGNELAVCNAQGVWPVCVTNDAEIVSGHADGTVRIWDMEGKQLAVCKGHKIGVFSVCVTSDGNIVSGSADGTVRVWDMQGNQLAHGHSPVYHLDMLVCESTDGNIIALARDGTMRVWDMSLFEKLNRMDKDRPRLLWELVQRVSQQGEIAKQEVWKEIEGILDQGAAGELSINYGIKKQFVERKLK